MTSSANATFSYAVRLGSRRKSWNTHPIERRKCGTFHDRMVVTSLVFTTTLPRFGGTSCSRSLMIVDLPEPEGPMKKTNSPFSMSTETSSREGRDAFGYVFVTWSSRITGGESTRCDRRAKYTRCVMRDLPGMRTRTVDLSRRAALDSTQRCDVRLIFSEPSSVTMRDRRTPK